jgi:formylglycine-generating enzyme required for sulfatase activity
MGREPTPVANADARAHQVLLMRFALLFLTLPLAAAVDFNAQVRPVLERACLGCHNAQRPLGQVQLQTRESLQRGPVNRPVLTPGDPAKSSLFISAYSGAMPPGGPKLTAAELDALRGWIAEGAQWPAGVVLSLKKPDLHKDDAALVQQLQKKIAANSKEQSSAQMKSYAQLIPGTEVKFEMVAIPGGEFSMGTPASQAGHQDSESPVHKVKLDPFWMQAREVTWDEYRLFMFHNADGKMADVDAVSHPTRPYVEMSFGMGINGFPAISMTQHAANKYAEWLSAKTGHFYRLPTEAEWEYACRAGTETAYSFGDSAAQLGSYAWYGDNSNGKYLQVGTRKPNAWGLYDMMGNVMEWTLDQYVADSYSKSPAANPWVKAAKPYPHSVRGGSWNDPPEMLRCGARFFSEPAWKMQDPQLPKSIWYHTDAQWLGFRLVRPLKVPSAVEMERYWNSGVEQEQ